MKSRKDNETNRQGTAADHVNQKPTETARRRRGAFIAMERKKEILVILSQKRRATYAELAGYFDVSTKTIQHDIEELTLAHPIETARGHKGGV